MNIVTRLAIIERLLEDAAIETDDQPTSAQLRRRADSGRSLVDDLDQAQMLKAASHLRPAPTATA